MWIVVDIVIAAFEIYAFFWLFSKSFVRRTTLPWCTVAGGGYVFLACLVRQWINDPLALMIVSFLACVALTGLFKMHWNQRILYPCMLLAVGIVLEILAGFALMRSMGLTMEQMQANPHSMPVIAAAIISKLLLLIAMRIVCAKLVTAGDTSPAPRVMAVLLIPVCSIAMLHGIATSLSACTIQQSMTPFLMLAGALAINTLVFIVYDTMREQSRIVIESQEAQSQMEREQSRYQLLVRHGQEMTGLVHDIKIHLTAVCGMLSNGKYAPATAYMKQLAGTLQPVSGKVLLPGYDGADFLLRGKIVEAEKNGITVRQEIHVPAGLTVSDRCLCVLLGNAMDNAIEACAKMEPSAESLIDLRIQYHSGKLIVRIANSTPPVSITDGLCRTTKKDAKRHGHGLGNIEKTIAAEGGIFSVDYMEKTFILSCIFPL